MPEATRRFRGWRGLTSAPGIHREAMIMRLDGTSWTLLATAQGNGIYTIAMQGANLLKFYRLKVRLP